MQNLINIINEILPEAKQTSAAKWEYQKDGKTYEICLPCQYIRNKDNSEIYRFYGGDTATFREILMKIK